jgi:lipid-A-disaccharide synthase
MTAATTGTPDQASGALEIFLVAVEESGDRLGAALMRALSQRSVQPVRFAGVGGQEMAASGLTSLFPIDDFSIIGFSAIPRRLPRIVSHMYAIVRAVLVRRPHALIIIDSPAFTLRIASFVRWFAPSIPIIDYVSPSVWAWHAGRARSMRGYIDHVLALLPFEPDVHRRLGGPPCSYVGHPLIEDVSKLRPNAAEAQRRIADPPIVLAMPGSRSAEVARLAGVYGAALALVAERVGPIEVVLPTVPHLLAQVTQATATWPIKPRIVVGQAEKLAALRVARAALAKSGTTTLELAVAGVPMVAAYKVSAIEAAVIRRLVRVSSYILANLVIGQNVVPELVQEDCTPDRLADTLAPLLGDTPQRQRQVDAFAQLDGIMEIGSCAPAARAADVVLAALSGQRAKDNRQDL